MLNHDTDPDVFELPPEKQEGRWFVREANENHLTPKRRLGQIAGALTHAHPDGWRFVEEAKDKNDSYGHIEYFIPDDQETK